jgi:thiamine biosynthesis protein ThiI
MYLVRYSEISIKSEPVRRRMEHILVRNIRDYLIRNKKRFDRVERIRGRIIVYSDEKLLGLKDVFGIASISPAVEVETDIERIKEAALKMFKKGTFRISTQRLTKEFKLTSEKMNRELGEYIVKNGGKVDLKNFDTEIAVEIYKNRAFVFTERIYGFGGLPIGSEGKLAGIIFNKRGVEAAKMMMKRGVCIIGIGDEKFINQLNKWDYGCKTEIIPFKGSIKKAMKNVNDITEKKKLLGVVTDLNLGKKKDLVLYNELREMVKIPIYAPLMNLSKGLM